ncbi:hypothetical protein QUF55_08510 [Clostridiaceae bacterium HSG29]|nr:hypothetical protein [Clostridiaceae bacterium HSG29]
MKNNDIYIGQEKDTRNLQIFLEALKRFREDDFKDIKNKKSNKDIMLHYFKKIDRWWI